MYWFGSVCFSKQNPKASRMPGLINKESQCALPLSVSDITCCVRGYTLALTASMTYENIEDHAIEGKRDDCIPQPYWGNSNLWASVFSSFFPEGIFIYPLEENSIVVGFEAMISSQIITLQIKGKAKLDDCYQDICHTANGALQSGTGKAEVTQINIAIWAQSKGLYLCGVYGVCCDESAEQHNQSLRIFSSSVKC